MHGRMIETDRIGGEKGKKIEVLRFGKAIIQIAIVASLHIQDDRRSSDKGIFFHRINYFISAYVLLILQEPLLFYI
jgi:hypothetical protein